MNVIDQILTGLVIQYLSIRKLKVIFFQSLQLIAEQFFFMQILSSFLIIVLPLGWKLFLDFQGRQSSKNGIPERLCRCRKDAVKTIFLLYAETLRKNGLDSLPLVES